VSTSRREERKRPSRNFSKWVRGGGGFMRRVALYRLCNFDVLVSILAEGLTIPFDGDGPTVAFEGVGVVEEAGGDATEGFGEPTTDKPGKRALGSSHAKYSWADLGCVEGRAGLGHIPDIGTGGGFGGGVCDGEADSFGIIGGL
jgi:hypothetical protein